MKKIVEKAMHARGISGKASIEALYDQDNEPRYILGVNKAGYIILAADTLACMESGQANPYRDYSDQIKYYGGSLQYSVKTEDGFFNILRQETSPTVESLANLDQIAKPDTIVEPTKPRVKSSKKITSAHAYIQRKAFGNNNDNTCTAVACTIALNYLNNRYNGNIVPAEFALEYLADATTDIPANYPKAHAFHRYLTDHCGIRAAAFARQVANGIRRYRSYNSIVSSTGIAARWVLNVLTNFGYNELNANRPILLTSTIAGAYSWHTMVVYGYRWLTDGSFEWLVHPGWYTSIIADPVTGTKYMPEIWVPASTATFLYKFTYK